MTRITTRVSRDDLRDMVASLPAMLSGRAPDRWGLAHGFRLRLAVAWFSKVKQAYIVKARGGTDEAGYSWPRQSREYLAYQRPMGGRGGKAPPKAGKLAPGGKDGFMTKAQLAQWRRDYAGALKWLMATMDLEAARGKAAAIAWSKAKAAGVKTKLDVFGSREVDILRDTGRLFNSLSPGTLNSHGVDAGYNRESADQLILHGTDVLILGTNVAYAAAHHKPKGNKRPTRRLWPEAERIPERWWADFRKQAAAGFKQIQTLLAAG